MGFLQDAWNANTKYNPLMIVTNSAVDFAKGAVDFVKEATAPSEINTVTRFEDVPPQKGVVDTIKDDFIEPIKDNVVEPVKDGWDDVKDKVGVTPIDTAYNIITGEQSVPSKIRTTISNTASNVVDAADDLGKGAVDAVKKYWPFAAAAVVGVIAIKAAAPEVIKKILN